MGFIRHIRSDPLHPLSIVADHRPTPPSLPYHANPAISRQLGNIETITPSLPYSDNHASRNQTTVKYSLMPAAEPAILFSVFICVQNEQGAEMIKRSF
jgi:hypothetical protein